VFIPRARSLRLAGSGFVFTEATGIAAPGALAGVAQWLQDALRPATGLPFPIDSDGTIRLELNADLGAEAYRLRVDARGIVIVGGDAAGVFYGCQTLRQSLPADIFRRSAVADRRWEVLALDVEDAPRFEWRGTMLDVARHFLPKLDLLRFIDLMAMHKLNMLHLHLTDDQGWRIEIRRYPRLTEVGSWRSESPMSADPEARGDGRPHGGYYTQDDIREIVAYAAERFVTVVPEVESPGHVQAAIASYPELGVVTQPLPVFTHWGINPNVLNAEESTVTFFQNVLDEVMDLFPSPFIGVGGDECPKDQWRDSPRVQRRMTELELTDEAGLQAWFIGRLDQCITRRGRRLFGWDEILEDAVGKQAVVASWRGMTGAFAAARRGHDVVACPDDVVYLDYRQSASPNEPVPVAIPLTLEDVYGFDPIPKGLTSSEEAHVLGGQANIWTEYMDSPRVVDFFAFPRLCAVAEALWSGPGGDFNEFEIRLAHAVSLRHDG
jgi:hexosaminidase